MSAKTYSVQSVHQDLLDTFHQYLRAQYHIWDESVIADRNLLLSQIGNTFQQPRIEATPQYAQGAHYSALDIPAEARAILESAASDPATGIPERAYAHQCLAIEQFEHGKDLIVATGTGSGKTESFLMPVLCSLAVESKKRPETWSLPGVRALLLYPMNALVNDQLGRLRKLFGSHKVCEPLCGNHNRYPRFGMYTSRTPYPGLRNRQKDRERVVAELNRLYIADVPPGYQALLQDEGKWPAKNITDFIDNNLNTSISDVELITRHEMQTAAPDLLVTNYSMLEYMMLRPIEATIFQQTAEWLASNEANVFTIVLDEAHMYRGSGGAEVAYLLRRLQSRLGIPRNRIRYILTSASLGSSEEARSEIKSFAGKLTGGDTSRFELITGELAARPQGSMADTNTQDALARFDYQSFLDATTNLDPAKAKLKDLAKALDINLYEPSPTEESLQQYAFDLLSKLPVAFFVADQLTTTPRTLEQCATDAFPNATDNISALEALLALMAFGKNRSESRQPKPFCPVRSHFFFRGLPGLYACTNVECSDVDSKNPRLLGRLFPNEQLMCNCGARVYELFTHRSCGAAYLRAYMKGADGNFLWHEPSTGTWTDRHLVEAQFYVIPEAELPVINGTIVWLHTPTGKLLGDAPAHMNRGDYLALLRPDSLVRDRGRMVLTLGNDCPACGQRPRREAPIAMDLATKGEAPFAHILRAQVAAQPIVKLPTPQAPNGGRKTIVFSDGRQKAARLARDIPREIELDVFRQVLFMSACILHESNKEPRLNNHLYVAFLKCLEKHNLRFFDGADRDHIERDLKDLKAFYDGDIEHALEDDVFRPPASYWALLLKQIGAPFYSITSLTLGYIVPTRASFKRLVRDMAGVPEDVVFAGSIAWIQRILSRFAFGRDDVSVGVREQASRYPFRPAIPLDGFSRLQRTLFESSGVDANQLADCLARNLCQTAQDGSIYLHPSHIALRSALNDDWVQCEGCKTISPVMIFGCCPNCARPSPILVDPNSTGYLRARKGFWRDPVAQAVAGKETPMSIDVQEHSAQLSYKDVDSPSPTTEVFERRFRDILRPTERSVDILSCTTTMEVGIDIGSLIAVAMRNVPPMRQNYQQRAGRAGRRGAAVSTVVTYAQSGAHDAYYFKNPDAIIAGDPPKPVLDTSNDNIASRHVFAQLLQDFFRPLATGQGAANIFTALGDTWSFFNDTTPTSFAAFKRWFAESTQAKSSLEHAQAWLPQHLTALSLAQSTIDEIESLAPDSEDGLEASLLEFLFARGLLPSYAFPTDLCSLQIQSRTPGAHGRIKIVEQAQQSVNVALSEYAPGRLVVLNKKTYRIGTVAGSTSDTEVNRAAGLFEHARVYRHCTQCSYTAGFVKGDDGSTTCPQCNATTLRTMTVITPEVVYPKNGREIDEFDDEQVFSHVSKAQLPLPEEELSLSAERFGTYGGLMRHRRKRLVVVNEGDPNAEESGFRVCSLCGKVLGEGELEGSHYRDYLIRRAGQQIPSRCNGSFERVFLGYAFTSDVLLLRIHLHEPLRFDIVTRRHRKPLEDALQTLCEALTLSIARVLDIESNEISAGFRFGNDGVTDFSDIFVYDTLSGGAGYALEAADSFSRVFDEAKRLLSNCTCSSSCENCLRHYRNRFSHSLLDRRLGLDLANYIEIGQVPDLFPSVDQRQILEPLIDMVKLAGGDVEPGTTNVIYSGKRFQLGACPSLRMCPPTMHHNGVTVFNFTPYEISRDLPSAFAELT